MVCGKNFQRVQTERNAQLDLNLQSVVELEVQKDFNRRTNVSEDQNVDLFHGTTHSKSFFTVHCCSVCVLCLLAACLL